jgi:hypothetical protein
MTTLASLVARCQVYLQDEAAFNWSPATIQAQIIDEITRISHSAVFGQAVPMQGVAGDPTYTFGAQTIAYAELIYDQKSLKPVSTDNLARYLRQWEGIQGDPQFFTTDLEAPQTVRVVPAPTRAGTPITQTSGALPFAQEAGNFLAFVWEQPQTDGTTVPLQAALDDVIALRAVATLVDNVGERQDQAKAQCFRWLATLMLAFALGDA